MATCTSKAAESEISILPGAEAQIRNQKESELSLKFRTGTMAIREVAPVLS